MTEVLWNVRLLDLELGVVSERRAIAVEDGVAASITDVAATHPSLIRR